MSAVDRVQIYAFDGTLVVTTRFQLLQWKHALHLEHCGLKQSRGSVSSHLRGLLKTPKGYPVENIEAHIVATIEDIDQQYNTGNFNFEETTS